MPDTVMPIIFKDKIHVLHVEEAFLFLSCLKPEHLKLSNEYSDNFTKIYTLNPIINIDFENLKFFIENSDKKMYNIIKNYF